MTTTTVQHVSLLTPRVAPGDSRGAEVAARLFAALCRAVGQAFQRQAPAAAAAPAADRQLEARSVRQLAARVENSDPGFAADLRAAAARHEGLIG